jgi:hypothetical protein
MASLILLVVFVAARSSQESTNALPALCRCLIRGPRHPGSPTATPVPIAWDWGGYSAASRRRVYLSSGDLTRLRRSAQYAVMAGSSGDAAPSEAFFPGCL